MKPHCENVKQTCHNCEWGMGEFCKYGNIERILRLEKHEPCPHWIPISNQEKYERFVKEVERKVEAHESY